MTPPKPASRPRRVSLWRYLRLFRSDILSAQPDHLFDAKMAEFRTPFFRSYLINQPDLVNEVLSAEIARFPKSMRVAEGLRPLLGNSVFVTNGQTWARQRRIIDPAFEAARLARAFPALDGAAKSAVARLTTGEVELEEWAAHGAADAIFRVMFSVPIEDRLAGEVYRAFQRYQRVQPIVNLGAFVALPRWMPRFVPASARAAAREIRSAIKAMVDRRMADIDAGQAPDDLATRIMTTPDSETGNTFDTEEMIDQVAIFFLAGHETSASALAWSLYLLAIHPQEQGRASQEALALPDAFTVNDLNKAKTIRDVFRETLRLYPPVPMMVREAARQEQFRNRTLRRGAQIVVSQWHLHRHRQIWSDPDAFNPNRFAEERQAVRDAFCPFSSGPRVCPGAGLAMIEGPLFIAHVLRAYHLEPGSERPTPVAHLTVRSKSGIYVRLSPRA